MCICVFVYLYICVFVYLCICVFVYLMSPQGFCLQGCLGGGSRLAPPLVFDIPDKGAPISFEKCPEMFLLLRICPYFFLKMTKNFFFFDN